MSDDLGSAFVDPFQGPQGAENTLKLAGVLAPRINLGGRPLQPGEGEGLRHLFSALGGFAEQKRRRAAEGQLLSGIQDVMAGNAPISTLQVSDLTEPMQRTLMEQVAKRGMQTEAQTQKQSAFDKIMATAQRRWEQPIQQSAPITEGGPVSFAPTTASSQGWGSPWPNPPATARVLTPQEFARLEFVHPGLGKNLQEQLSGQQVVMPRDSEMWDKLNQIVLHRNTPPSGEDYLQQVTRLQTKFPGLFPSNVQTIMQPSGPKVIFSPLVPHNIGAGQESVVTGPTGNEVTRIPGPPPIQEQNIQFLPSNLQQPAREAMTGLRPKAGEAGRLAESALNREARESKPRATPAGRAPSQFRDLVNSYKDEFSTLEPTPDTSNEWFGKASQSPRQQAEASAKAMEKNDPTEARAMRQAIRELFGSEVKALKSPTGTRPQPSAPTTQQTRPIAKTAADFFKKYGE